MRFGTGLPLTAIPDVSAVRDTVQTLDGGGMDFITIGGHLLSLPPDSQPGRPAMTYVGPFYDVFVLFSYLAAVTQRIQFYTAILILPELQTALVAKQAAELSHFSGGRFQLGVGISWSEAEYQAMNQNIHNRGRRLEEQITVLRKMWTEPFVTFEGRWHHLDNIGLNRLPQRPIPIWIGSGTDEKVLKRVARLADGWMPLGDPTEPMVKLRQFLAEAGRDPSTFGLTGRLMAGPEGAEAWVKEGQRLQSVGVTDLIIGSPPDLAPPQGFARVIEAKNVLASALG